MKEHTIEISNNFYRYRYDPSSQKTVYLGPVGSAPEIDEEQFLSAVAIAVGPLVEDTGPRKFDDDVLVFLIESNNIEPTSKILFERLGIPSSEHDRIKKRLKVREKLSGNSVKEVGPAQYRWEIRGPEGRLFASGVSPNYTRAHEMIRSKREWFGLPERNTDSDRVIREYDPIKDRIHGGLGDYKHPSHFDRGQMEWGILVELEHTNDPNAALEIAIDHLMEEKDYYTELERIESHLDD